MTQKTAKTFVPKLKKKNFSNKTTDHCSPEKKWTKSAHERLEEVTRLQSEKKFSSSVILSGTTSQKLNTLVLVSVPHNAGHCLNTVSIGQLLFR